MANGESLQLIINMIVRATANSGDEGYGGNAKTIKKVRIDDRWYSAHSIPKLKRDLREHLIDVARDHFQHPHAAPMKGVVQQVPRNENPIEDVLLAIFGHFHNAKEPTNNNDSKTPSHKEESEQEGSTNKGSTKTYTRKSAFDIIFIHSITPYYNDSLQYSNGGLIHTMPNREHNGSNLFIQETHITLYPIHIILHLDALLKKDTSDNLNINQFSPEYMTECVKIILNCLRNGIPSTSNGVHNTFTPLYFDAFLSRTGGIQSVVWSYGLVNKDGRIRIEIRDYWRSFISKLIVRDETPDKKRRKIVGYIEHTDHFYIPTKYKNEFLYPVDPNNDWGQSKWDKAQEKVWPQFLSDLEKRLLEFFTQLKSNS